MKKRIEGCDTNKSSIINMTTIDDCLKQRTKNHPLNESSMKNILSYKDGPTFREVAITTNISKENPYTRNKGIDASKSHRSQKQAYQMNKFKGHRSNIPFS